VLNFHTGPAVDAVAVVVVPVSSHSSLSLSKLDIGCRRDLRGQGSDLMAAQSRGMVRTLSLALSRSYLIVLFCGRGGILQRRRSGGRGRRGIELK